MKARALALGMAALASACGAATTPTKSDVIVVAAATSAQPPPVVVAPVLLAPASSAQPAAASPLSVRMRDELAAVATSQATGADDERLYRQGVDAERAGDLASARKAYYELITSQPSSPLVPYAYLAFGELFLAEAEGDPTRWALAKQAYEKVITYPPPQNRASAYAYERHALCAEKTGDHARALASARKAIEAARMYPQLPLASEVAESAVRTLVEAYAAAGDPAKAFLFFSSWDRTSAPQTCVELGDAYVRRGQHRELVLLYRELLSTLVPRACDGALRAAEELERKGVDRSVPASLRAHHARYCRTP